MKLIDRIIDKIFRKNINIIYCENLYLSDGLTEKKADKLKKKAEQGKGSGCLLLKSENKDDCIDIVTSFQLKSKVWEGKSVKCIGLADSKDSATELVQSIIKDCLEKTGKIDLKEYICSL
ncbi:MAG: hypothetical protein J6U41_08595 [Lachnospiraceae bacterium]|nr:hypothetical protein [Lachnospiraceae bacterium]